MKDNNAYIVIAQTHEHVLEEIKEIRDKDSKNYVMFTTNPGDVLKEVIANPVDIVITGQNFYQSDLRSAYDCLKAMAGGLEEIAKHYNPPLSGPDRGSELSKEIYKIKPEILVFRYSLTPEEKGRIVADIRKFGGPRELLKLVDSPLLPEILRIRDWKKLMESFPQIHFYDGWEKEH